MINNIIIYPLKFSNYIFTNIEFDIIRFIILLVKYQLQDMVRIIMTYGILSKLNWTGIIYEKTQDFILTFSVLYYGFYTTFSGVFKVVI